MTLMFPENLIADAEQLLGAMRGRNLRLCAAESCTGGLIAGLFTSIAGSSDVFERGFVTYSNEAKIETLGVSQDLLQGHGAVSEAVAAAMAEGALVHSHAQIALSVTGIAGPGGGSEEKPVGLVFIGCAGASLRTRVSRFTFGDRGRQEVRLASVSEALILLKSALDP